MTQEFIGGLLPLFPMRKYENLEREGTKVYIYTHFDKYILDDTSLSGNYIERRLSLQFSKDPKLYPIKKICNTLQELVNSGSKVFIDTEGRLVRWSKQKYYTVYSQEVLKANMIAKTSVEMFFKIPEGGLQRVVASKYYKYVRVVKLGPMCYMPLDFGDDYESPCKKKL